MTSGIADAVPVPPEPKPNPFARMVGVLVSPGRTFASIARRPDWVVPLVVLLIITIAASLVFVQRVDFGSMIRQQIEQRKDMSPDQADRAVRMGTAVAKTFAYFSPVITAIIFVIIAAVLLLASRLFGGEGNFRQAFSTTLYAWIPNIIKTIVLTVVIFAKGHVDPLKVETAVRSNLGFLSDPTTHPMAFAVLSSADLFTLWTLVLFIIGLAAFSRLSTVKAATIVICLWLVTVFFKLIPAAIRAVKMKG